MRQKLATLANLQEGAIWFPIIGLFFISIILLVIVTGPANFFELGQLGQRKTEQKAEATSNQFSIILNPNADYDDDGFKNGAETYMGTEPFASCPTDTSRNAWPPDFNNDKAINILDIGLVTNNFGKQNKRFDLNQDGSVNIIDIGLEKSYFGKFCSNPNESDSSEQQKPPDPNASDTLDPILEQIAQETITRQSEAFIATNNEFPPALRQTLDNYFLQNQSQAIASSIVCATQSGDMKVFKNLDYLWAAGFGCYQGNQVDYAAVIVTLQYYDWGGGVWRNEKSLGQLIKHDVSSGLIWGALRVEPYNGINCRRIRTHFRFEDGNDVSDYYQPSGGECY